MTTRSFGHPTCSIKLEICSQREFTSRVRYDERRVQISYRWKWCTMAVQSGACEQNHPFTWITHPMASALGVILI